MGFGLLLKEFRKSMSSIQNLQHGFMQPSVVWTVKIRVVQPYVDWTVNLGVNRYRVFYTTYHHLATLGKPSKKNH